MAGAAGHTPAILGEHPHPCDEDDEMSAGSPGEDSEPASAPDPWASPADFSQPAPAAWSAPVDWTQSAPPPWPGRDAPAAQPAGNGFSPAGSDPSPTQPGANPPTSQYDAPPAGQYGYPPAGQFGYQPGYPPTARRTSPVAIAALICGVVQFFLGLFAVNFVLAIPAIICGAIGLRQTRLRGEGGRGLSIAGLVLGILGIVWNVLYVVLIVYLGRHVGPTNP
jgi:hypothetical protein